MDQQYCQQVAEKALAYCARRLSSGLTVPRVARSVALSTQHLRRVFRLATGESIHANINRLRLDRAKSLLASTQLSNTEVALEAGFGSYTRFAVAFKKSEGMTPGQFRRSLRLGTGVVKEFSDLGLDAQGKEWFRDEFGGSFLRDCWEKQQGEWHVQDGLVSGRSLSQATLVLATPLPENFRVSFDAFFLEEQGLKPSDLIISLRAQDRIRQYYTFVLGARGNTMSEMLCQRVTVEWNDGAIVRKNGWMHVELQLHDNLVRLLSDQVEVFSYRNPFPSPYPNRSIFTVGCWQSTIHIRNLVVHDLGFVSSTPPIRRGDTLYNVPLYDKARDLYARLLAAGPSPDESMELRYKIGMCLMNESALDQSREWLQKVATVPGNAEWQRLAQVAMLQLDWMQNDIESFGQDARRLFRDRANKVGIRDILRRAAGQAYGAGFFQTSLDLDSLLCELEKPGTPAHVAASMSMAGRYQSLRDHAAAIPLYRSFAEDPRSSEFTVLAALFQLGDVYARLGQFDESDQALKQIKGLTRNPYELARCQTSLAHNLRGRGEFEGAVRQYLAVMEVFPQAEVWAWFGQMEAFLVLGMLGQTQKASLIYEHSLMENPRSVRSDYQFAREVFRNNLDAAAITLEKESRNPGSLVSRAEATLKTAMLWAASGQDANCRALLREGVKRFPPETCAFYGSLAQRMLDQKPMDLQNMPGIPRNRSELMFCAGLYHEGRGEARKAMEVFEMAAQEDLTNRWPAYLAKRKLLP